MRKGAVEVIEARRLDDFIKFPLDLYSKDPFFVPQLNREMKVHFSPKNPFYQDAEIKYFIALKDGKIAGRIAAFVNSRHNEFHNEKTGFFGFFDCVHDSSVSDALFSKAGEFLRGKEMESMRGPMNFSTNEECGFLLEGFDEPPFIMMPYNQPYYIELTEKFGLKKIKDLYAYIYKVQDDMPEKVYRVAAIAEKRGISVRPINMKRFKEDMMIFREVYESAWQDNWGFIPMSEQELQYSAERLKQIIVPEMILIAEKDGAPIGFFGLVPDFNSVLQHMNGKLNPVTIAKALYYSRKIKDLRVMLLGIKKEFRNKGVEALLYKHGWPPIKRGKYERVEFSWILEDNIPVQRTIEIFGGKVYKKYRIYQISL
jgi:GNAT superfamily N-acetyltransferase